MAMATPSPCPVCARTAVAISLEFTIVPIRAEDGRMEGMVAILRDVTHRFEEMRALRREIGALKARSAASGQA